METLERHLRGNVCPALSITQGIGYLLGAAWRGEFVGLIIYVGCIFAKEDEMPTFTNRAIYHLKTDLSFRCNLLTIVAGPFHLSVHGIHA